jgi:ABC-2 type transport system permease protein
VPELLAAEFRRYWIGYRRYPGEVISGIVMMTITFLALLAGGAYIAGPGLGVQAGARIDALIVGYWIWTLILLALADGASTIQREAVAGTLEQLYLSPFGPVRIIVTRSAAAIVLHVATTLVLLGVMLLITGRRLQFDPAMVLPLITVLAAAMGISLAFGAAALVLKRVDQLLSLARFLLLIPIVFPVENTPRLWPYLMPMTPGSALLRGLMVSASERPFDWFLLIVAAVNGVVYLLIGVLAYGIADRYVRRHGLLGQH